NVLESRISQLECRVRSPRLLARGPARKKGLGIRQMPWPQPGIDLASVVGFAFWLRFDSSVLLIPNFLVFCANFSSKLNSSPRLRGATGFLLVSVPPWWVLVFGFSFAPLASSPVKCFFDVTGCAVSATVWRVSEHPTAANLF